MQAKQYDLGVTPSHSRTRVSNDNPYSESLFRTLIYCPQWPRDGFVDMESAKEWVDRFVRWQNTGHIQSGIKYVTPDEKHQSKDREVLAQRQAVV